MDINAIETLRAPNVYDTGNFFEYANNWRTDKKDYQPYWFTQGGKLEFGNARNQTAQIDNDEYAIQVRNGQNGYYATEDTTGSNATKYRIEKGIWQKPFDIGNATRPWQVIHNNQNKTRSTMPQGKAGTLDESSAKRGYGQVPSTRAGQKRSSEGFREALTTTPYGPGSAYTSEPNPLTSNNSSALQPQMGIPDEFIDKSNCRGRCNTRQATEDIKNGFRNLGNDFGNTVPYNMTVGGFGKKQVKKEGYREALGDYGYPDMPVNDGVETAKKVGITILIVIACVIGCLILLYLIIRSGMYINKTFFKKQTINEGFLDFIISPFKPKSDDTLQATSTEERRAPKSNGFAKSQSPFGTSQATDTDNTVI